MKNLLTFFFSFDKLFKEKLVLPAFLAALVYFGLEALKTAVDGVQLDPLLWIINPIAFIASLVFGFLALRIIAELVVAIFRINDNLSPDKGRSELVDIDPVAEARKAAEVAAARTREVTQTATEKTKATLGDVRESIGDTTDTLTAKAKDATGTLSAKAKDATQSAKERTESVMGHGSVPEPGDEPTPVKILEPTEGDLPKKRGPGRPKGSKNKPKPAGATTTAKRGPGRPKGSKNKSSSTKPGPKKGTPIPRDADGNLLKKDGTPRKKPGPKPKPKTDGPGNG